MTGSLRPHPATAIQTAMAGHGGPATVTPDAVTQLLKLQDEFTTELGVAAVAISKNRSGTVLDGGDVKQAFDRRAKSTAAARRRELYYATCGIMSGGTMGSFTTALTSSTVSVLTIIVTALMASTGIVLGIAAWRST
ncbi:hypothetical protein [Nocardia sp. NPDC060259]|uniref:hypothetical protein n=1 Tax=Nocardia sp. NPDC060259 TaxID=3347088 RepID=UPI003654B43B